MISYGVILWFCLRYAFANSNTYSVRLGDINAGLNIPQKELNALFILYNATDGPNWSWPPDRNRTGLLPWERGGPWEFTPHANPCIDNWYGIECTNSSPQQIKNIILPAQNMSGTLPSAIGDFSALHKMTFRHNPKLHGTIPDVFKNTTNLQGVDMSHNSLSGSLPPSLLASASTLESLVVYRNLLTGTFPTFLCNLTYLLELNLANNSMHGTIPDCIGQLTRIHGLTVSVNNFNGMLPQTIGNMTNLEEISFDSNAFTGAIPASIGNLTNLNYLGLFITEMSGQIPDSICRLQYLEGLFVYNAYFSGTIPHCMSNMTKLKTFDANVNHFTGTIPPNLLSKKHMQDFAIRYSDIHDTLPSVFASSLQTLELQGNRMYGTVPSALFALHDLQVLELVDNQFTGPLPSSIRASQSLATLNIGQNYFTGSIPSDIGNCTALGFVLISDNLLSGTLPRSIAHLPTLAELNVEDNFLSGSLLGAIDSSVHTVLTTILLNNNRFTGQIPDDIFRLHALSVFAAVSNCFDTQLTDAMCKSETIVTLALDGMRSGASCRANLLHGLTSAYMVDNAQTQKIPTCLFEMKTLTTLHLSGNGLTGSLPNNVTISPTLTDLSLSHNDLTGVIPEIFQIYPWDALDLSYNRLTGTLLKSFAAGVDLALENNRISGRIPTVLLNSQQISILGSNIFECDEQDPNLPQKDDGRKNYHCASKSFDTPYYAWLVLLLICVAVALLTVFVSGGTRVGARVREVRARLVAALAHVHNEEFSGQLRSLLTVFVLYEQACVLATICVGYMLVVLVPFYFAAAKEYGTYYHQYAWQVSAGLLSGSVASAVMMALLLLLVCGLLVSVYILKKRAKRNEDLARESRVSSRPNSTSSLLLANATVVLSWFERCSVYALFMLVSVSVVIGVNIAYVLVVLNEKTSTVVAVQILLAFFKLFWNNFCSKNLMHWAGRQISKSVEATESVYAREFHFVQLLVSLINNIGIPCIVVAVVSPSCLYNIFVAAPVVKASYNYEECVAYGLVAGRCLVHDLNVGETAYHPPFTYSYQCSSSIVTYYAPAFVFLCITATFLTPTSQFLAMRLARSEQTPSFIRRALLTYCMPKILKPLELLADAPSSSESASRSPYFDANRAAILLFSYFGMLMTFGAVFPPLAVALMVTILSTTFFIKLKIGNFVGSAITLKATHLLRVFNSECEQLARLDTLTPSVWLIVTFSCWFYTLFLFDTLGDSVGFHRAYWVLIVMPLMPVCLYIICRAVNVCSERHDKLEEQRVVSEATISPLSEHGSSNMHVEMGEIYSKTSAEP